MNAASTDPASTTTRAIVPTGQARPSILRDVARGAFLGDFADELGLPGAATQVGLSFVPVLGALCDLRDAAASRRRGDTPGIALNLLALLPLVGGIAKGVGVWRHAKRLQRGLVVSYHQRQSGDQAALPRA